jgi:hypothetical protein
MTYDSPRHLCPLLIGSIEGAATRYGEQALVREQACMRHGAPACIFAIRFFHPSGSPYSAALSAAGSGAPSDSHSPAQQDRWDAQRRLADAVYTILPDDDGVMLSEAQRRMQARFPEIEEAARPFILLEAINHLVHVGWVATSANEPGDALGTRRYWRAPRAGN